MTCKQITKRGDAKPKKMCACYFGHPSEKRSSMPFDAVNLRMLNAWTYPCLTTVANLGKGSVPGINIVTSVLSLADRTLEKAFLDSGKFDLGLVS